MRKIIMCLCLFFISCMAILISGCTNEAAVNESYFEKSVSDELSHSKLVQSYAKVESLSENEAEAKIAAMNLAGLESESEQYRMVSLPVEKDKSHYIIWIILISDEKNDDWKVKSIESAWIEKPDDEEQIFLGTVNFWIRGERKLEYAAYGDFYNYSDIKIEFQKEKNEERVTINISPIGEYVLNSLDCLELHQTLKI